MIGSKTYYRVLDCDSDGTINEDVFMSKSLNECQEIVKQCDRYRIVFVIEDIYSNEKYYEIKR